MDFIHVQENILNHHDSSQHARKAMFNLILSNATEEVDCEYPSPNWKSL